MSKIYYLLIALLFFAFVLPGRVAAQGMMDLSTTDTEVSEELSDIGYEKLGEQWMELMIGDSHEAADEQMRTMMGEDFLKQMHIAMGKRAQNPGSFGMMPMMGMMGLGRQTTMGADTRTSKYGWPLASNPKYSGTHSVLMVITWLSFITFLLAGARWFWKKANK